MKGLRKSEQQFLDNNIYYGSDEGIHVFLEDTRAICLDMHNTANGILALLKGTYDERRLTILMDQEIIKVRKLRQRMDRLPDSGGSEQKHKEFVKFSQKLLRHVYGAKWKFWYMYRNKRYLKFSREKLIRKITDYVVHIGRIETDIRRLTNAGNRIQAKYRVDAAAYSHMDLNEQSSWDYVLNVPQEYVFIDTNVIVDLFKETLKRKVHHVNIKSESEIILLSCVLEESINLFEKYKDKLREWRNLLDRKDIDLWRNQHDFKARAAMFLENLRQNVQFESVTKSGYIDRIGAEHLHYCNPAKKQAYFKKSADPKIMFRVIQQGFHSTVCVWTMDRDFKYFFHSTRHFERFEKYVKRFRDKVEEVNHRLPEYDLFKERIVINDRL